MAKSNPNPPPKIPPWTERNEVNLLNAILEIANEPIESYDPRINLFNRINKNMEKSLADREILDKIKELRNRFEKRCWMREFGNKAVKTTRAFAISEKIWGKGMEVKIVRKRRKKKKKKGKNAKSLKVYPQEASGPNPKQEHESTKKRNNAEPKYICQPAGKKQKVKGSCFVCGNFGHVAHDCFKKKIAKQPTKQQELKDISKGFVELQFETENNYKELSRGSALASSGPGSLRLTSEQTKQRDEVRNSSQPVAQQLTSKKKVEDYNSSQSVTHQPSSEQRMKFNNLQRGDNQHTSAQTKQRDELCDCSQPVAQDYIISQSIAHQPSSEHRMKFNNLQRGDIQHTSERAKRRDEMRDSSQPVAQDYVSSQSFAHQPSSEQRMKFNNSQRGDNQNTSEQRMKVPSSFKPGTYQHMSKQKKPFNRFRPTSHQHISNQWKRESFTPPISPPAPNWGPPNPIAMPHSFTPHPVPYQYPPPPVFLQSPPHPVFRKA